MTGSHRSGTTWVGRMLAASGELGYVHEPFNPNRSPGWFPTRLPYWFLYITDDNEVSYLDAARRLVELRYPLLPSLLAARSARLVGMNLQQAAGAARDRARRRRLLLKDPMALFSAPWLARRFDMRVIVLVRHPAAFVSSIKRLNWGFDYERNWLAQPLLMRDLLTGYEQRFSGYRGEHDLVGEGIVVWNAIYDVVSRFRAAYPGWNIVRYEDVARNPGEAFRSLYDFAGLRWTSEVERAVDTFSNATNRSEVTPGRRHEIRRDSKAAAATWRTRLGPEEIDRIRAATEDVWRRFYSDADWS